MALKVVHIMHFQRYFDLLSPSAHGGYLENDKRIHVGVKTILTLGLEYILCSARG